MFREYLLGLQQIYTGSSASTGPFRRHLLVSEWDFREVNEPSRRMEEFLNGKGGENILTRKGSEKAVRKACCSCSFSVFRWTLCSSICQESMSITAPEIGLVFQDKIL